MDNIHHFFTLIKKYCRIKKIEAYLVGGAVRNVLLKKKYKDIDIVLNGPIKETACFFADKSGGSFITLDDKREIYRVVIKDYTFDFNGMKGNTIEDDLQKRDFTVNALAVPLQKLSFRSYNIKISLRDIIDPAGGFHDLLNRLLQAVHPEVFVDDPLRLWRVFRFKVQYNLKITAETSELIKQNKNLAADPAFERIHDELIKIFTAKKVSAVIREMENKYFIFSTLFPAVDRLKETGKNRYHKEDAWEHSLQVLEYLEKILNNDEFEYKCVLSDKFGEHVKDNDIYLLKAAALFHDIGKIKCCQVKDDDIHYYGHDREGALYVKKFLKKIKFSSKEVNYICGLIKFHMRPLMLYLADNLSIKGKLRFFNEADKLTVPVLLLSLADKSSNMMYNKREENLKSYLHFINELFLLYNNINKRVERDFINGSEVMELTGIKEGPRIGQILKEIKIEQALGNIKNREETVSYLKRHYQKRK